MTASTLDREAGEGIEDGADHVVPVEVPCDLAVEFRFGHLGVADVVPGACRQEAGCHNTVDSGGEQYVAGNLLQDEAVEWFVGIECANHVISIRPGVGTQFVLVVSVGVAVMSHVEPVPGPSFSVTGTLQKSLNESRIGSFRVVGKKGGDLARSRRKACQVDSHAANKRAAIGWD